MRQIPSTVVISILALVVASWPGVQNWSELTSVNHYLAHCLYLVAGGLFGLQTAWWIHSSVPVSPLDEGGVSS